MSVRLPSASERPSSSESNATLAGVRVLDRATGIAGSYAAKLFADSGAYVVKLLPEDGLAVDPGEDPVGSLRVFLDRGKTACSEGPSRDRDALFRNTDLVVDDSMPGTPDAEIQRARHPALVWLSITPFGRDGPYAQRPWSDLTVQAESGCLAMRGLPEDPPLAMGGRVLLWLAGVFAAVPALAAVRHALRTGEGELIDFSIFESATLGGGVYADLHHAIAGHPPLPDVRRSVELPSIEPTVDGWIGFNTNTREQFESFLLLIERPDLMGDEELKTAVGRWKRREEWTRLVRQYTRTQATSELLERAALLRIPVAPVSNGGTLEAVDHFQARQVFELDPRHRFTAPCPPYKIDGVRLKARSEAPSAQLSAKAQEERSRWLALPSLDGDPRDLPLQGVRILDATAWWAGPMSTQVLALLGAEVIHVEAIQRMDGARSTAGAFQSQPRWWERASLYLGANTNKRNLTLDLSSPRGIELLRELIPLSDVLVENYSPRVFDNFGIDWPSIRALSPRTSFVRMPAFGLDGPWRDRVGFAQTMEQVSGLAWLTGFPHDQPRIQRGPCDPIAGLHAAFAIVRALVERDKTGRGQLVECSMVESALNVAAQPLLEWSAQRRLLGRLGNRSADIAPQGVYPCQGREQWLALAVRNATEWQGLRKALGGPPWMASAKLETEPGRRNDHDRIDTAITEWTTSLPVTVAFDRLVSHGVPAAPLRHAECAQTHPQHLSRSFYEEVEHGVIGRISVPTVPFRLASREHWDCRAAPTLGQDNRQLLRDLLGLEPREIDDLERDRVIGTRPLGI